MQQPFRHEQILAILHEQHTCSVQEFCGRLYCSPATVRRDLHRLEQEGLIRLFHGGAMLSVHDPVLPLSVRENDRKEAKKALARRAAALIPKTGGATVMLDSSSTAMYIANYLEPEHRLKVFTNCLRTAGYLCERGVESYIIGGAIDRKSAVSLGSFAADMIGKLHVDYLFFSSQGLDAGGIISDNAEEETYLRRIMIRSAAHSYFICDSAKVGKRFLFTVCGADGIEGVISDGDLSDIPGVRHIAL